MCLAELKKVQQIRSKNTYHISPSHNNSVCQCPIWQIIVNTPNTTWNPMVGVGIQHGRLGQKKKERTWLNGYLVTLMAMQSSGF
jgi:hypothetical protein